MTRAEQALRKSVKGFVNSGQQELVARLLWEACSERFYEDNVPTRRAMLAEYIETFAQDEIAANEAVK